MNRVSLFLLVSALFIVSTFAQSAPNTINQDVASGRCYQYINTTVTSWAQAKAAADASSFNGVPGYLVTVTSQAEENYIFTTVISNTSASFVYTAGIANSLGEYIWSDGPENGQKIVNSTGSCVQSVCFFRAGFPTAFTVNNSIQYSLDGWSTGTIFDVAGYIIEYGNATNPCVPSVTPTVSLSNTILPSASNAPTTTTTTSTTTGLSISPSNFRPTITITSTVSTTSVSRTTGRRTTGKRGTTTGKRGTTGKVSAASSMTFSAVSVFVAGVTLLFLRR
jgi:hypothetical protein